MHWHTFNTNKAKHLLDIIFFFLDKIIFIYQNKKGVSGEPESPGSAH